MQREPILASLTDVHFTWRGISCPRRQTKKRRCRRPACNHAPYQVDAYFLGADMVGVLPPAAVGGVFLDKTEPYRSKYKYAVVVSRSKILVRSRVLRAGVDRRPPSVSRYTAVRHTVLNLAGYISGWDTPAFPSIVGTYKNLMTRSSSSPARRAAVSASPSIPL
jgi:hypothetical protein